MKNTFSILFLAVLMLSCSKESDLESKKEELAKYEKEAQEAESKASALRKEIAAIDPNFNKAEQRSVLVTTIPAQKKTFTHYIEVSGTVESKKNIMLSAESAGAITRIPVVEGQQVQRGQLLVSQDTEVLQRNLQELQTSLDLATTIFEKQSNLWEQKIGTEVQYLQARNNKESLENRVKTLRSQIAKANITAPFSGVVDQIMMREGENAMPGSPVVRIVSLDEVYVQADLSESYLGKVKKGDNVVVNVPSINKEYEGTIRSVGQVLNMQNRTFPVEINLKNTQDRLMPKMLAVVKLKSFEQDSAVVVPSNLIQRDKNSEFLFIASKNGDKHLAQKVEIKRGETYQNETLVKSGLQGGELLINDGFREVADSVVVNIVQN